MKRWGLFAGWLLAIFAVWLLLQHHEFADRNDRDTATLLFVAACVIGVSVLIMFVETTQWTARRLGVFGLILFDCLLYGLTSSIALWRWTALTNSRLNVLRALLLVSATLLVISQARYLSEGARDRWRAGKDAP